MHNLLKQALKLEQVAKISLSCKTLRPPATLESFTESTHSEFNQKTWSPRAPFLASHLKTVFIHLTNLEPTVRELGEKAPSWAKLCSYTWFTETNTTTIIVTNTCGSDFKRKAYRKSSKRKMLMSYRVLNAPDRLTLIVGYSLYVDCQQQLAHSRAINRSFVAHPYNKSKIQDSWESISLNVLP